MTGLPTGCLRLGGFWPSSRKYKLDPMSSEIRHHATKIYSRAHPASRDSCPSWRCSRFTQKSHLGAVGSVLVWVSVQPPSCLALSSLPHHNSWLAWTCDAIDFVAVSLTVPLLSEQFGRSTSAIVRPFLSLPLLFAPLMRNSDMVKDNRLNVDAFIPISRCRKYHICYSPLSLPFPR